MNTNVVHLPVNNTEIPDRVDRDWVTSTELFIESGITYRQCDYWTRTHLLTSLTEANPGSGNPRRYPENQVTRARALRHLLDAGVSLVTCREVIDEFITIGHVTVGHITFTHNPGDDAA